MSDLVTDTAVLPIGEGTVWFVSGLLSAERVRRGRRALGCGRPAVLVLRWFVDGTRVGQLAVEAPSVHPPYIATCPRRSTCSQPPHPACPAPCSLPAPLGTPVHLDGTLIRTDRSGVVGPTGGVDLCWSGQHHQHGGNVEVVTAPDGWPRWISPVRPGRAHGTAPPARHPHRLGRRRARCARRSGRRRRGHPADLPGQEQSRQLTTDQCMINALHAATRAGRTQELPAQGHLQGAASGQPLPLADRRDHRRSAGPLPPRPQPHHVINKARVRLPGKAQWRSTVKA